MILSLVKVHLLWGTRAVGGKWSEYSIQGHDGFGVVYKRVVKEC